jgi:hypothetical protein
MWAGFWTGDYKYIIPTKVRADVLVDTYFPYDVGGHQAFVSEHLLSVTENMPYFERVCEIMDKLTQVKEIEAGLAASHGFIREFNRGRAFIYA